MTIALRNDDKEEFILCDELALLQKIAETVSDLNKARNWEEFRERFPIKECEESLIAAVRQWENWLSELETIQQPNTPDAKSEGPTTGCVNIPTELLEDILEDEIELYNLVYPAYCVPGEEEKIKAVYGGRVKEIKKLLKEYITKSNSIQGFQVRK